MKEKKNQEKDSKNVAEQHSNRNQDKSSVDKQKWRKNHS